MGNAVEDWKGGRLRLFMPTPPLLDVTSGNVVDRVEIKDAVHEYEPLGDGWAVRADLPLRLPMDGHGLDGISVELDMRDGRLQCVAVASKVGGPALTTSVLRRLGPVTSDLVAHFQTVVVVRLIELDEETVAAELPLHRPTDERPVASPTELSDDFRERYGKRPGRRPLSDEHLREVARLYREAKRLGKPASPYIAEAIPGPNARATIRNWIRKARERGYLETKGEDNG